jgi:glycerate 2-kinase
MRQTAENIFRAGVAAVLPDHLIRSQLRVEGDVLTVGGDSYVLSAYRHIYVLGAGKASALMALEIEKMLPSRITDGYVVTKYGHGCTLQHITCTEAAHPVPDENSLTAALEILKIARKAQAGDLVLCLISGGASSLMADTPDNINLADLRAANELLVTSGASISEINTIRKHLSEVKGGQLARAIHPATCISLILSDVVGDYPEVIASGPTAPDSTTFNDAYSVLKHYQLDVRMPESVLRRINSGKAGLIAETPDAGNSCFSLTYNYIIGNNRIALEASADYARRCGLKVSVITDSLHDDYRNVAEQLLAETEKHTKHSGAGCLLFGGEPTVKVTAKGLGGRNQHLALYLATQLNNRPGITILCAGSDGTDGPTDAAGAVVDAQTLRDAERKGVDAAISLRNADSYHFFSTCGGHIVTGNTKTNVMDIILIIYNY